MPFARSERQQSKSTGIPPRSKACLRLVYFHPIPPQRKQALKLALFCVTRFSTRPLDYKPATLSGRSKLNPQRAARPLSALLLAGLAGLAGCGRTTPWLRFQRPQRRKNATWPVHKKQVGPGLPTVHQVISSANSGSVLIGLRCRDQVFNLDEVGSDGEDCSTILQQFSSNKPSLDFLNFLNQAVFRPSSSSLRSRCPRPT